MPKSKAQDHVLALFAAANSLTDELFLLISKKNPQFVGEIADRYSKRGKILEAIDKWRRVHADEFQHSDFQSSWQQCSQLLQDNDAQLMQDIPDMRDKLQSELVDLNKRKYLLLYSRGPQT